MIRSLGTARNELKRLKALNNTKRPYRLNLVLDFNQKDNYIIEVRNLTKQEYNSLIIRHR